MGCCMANTDDHQQQPLGSNVAAEPCETNVLLESIETNLECWENTVSYYSEHFDTDDDFDHEVFGRYCLHGLVNGYISENHILPEHILARLQAADSKFMAITFEMADTSWNCKEHHDKAIFWYYYRFPLSSRKDSN